MGNKGFKVKEKGMTEFQYPSWANVCYKTYKCSLDRKLEKISPWKLSGLFAANTVKVKSWLGKTLNKGL